MGNSVPFSLRLRNKHFTPFCDVFVWKWGPRPRRSSPCYHGNKFAVTLQKRIFLHPSWVPNCMQNLKGVENFHFPRCLILTETCSKFNDRHIITSFNYQENIKVLCVKQHINFIKTDGISNSNPVLSHVCSCRLNWYKFQCKWTSLIPEPLFLMTGDYAPQQISMAD